MPARSLADLYLFPQCVNRDDYRRQTGHDAPPYDPSRPPKNWFDSAAADSPRRTVVYDSAFVLGDAGMPMSDAEGRPLLDVLALHREEAASVNIWHDQTGAPAPSQPPVAVPLRPLEDDEELYFVFPGVVALRSRSWRDQADGFHATDRTMLRAIAKKLGVLV